jgi:putative methionine-R-sulfoxide reductase with GAF domain
VLRNARWVGFYLLKCCQLWVLKTVRDLVLLLAMLLPVVVLHLGRLRPAGHLRTAVLRSARWVGFYLLKCCQLWVHKTVRDPVLLLAMLLPVVVLHLGRL